ncbi:MAG: ABC transporter permease [Anaerolineae bacterium]|nr:ABC transporter permease [Anaerolineae bacterium]MDW8069435.1 ABC transporter permease [Anaerolineae bacterium]
MGKVNIVGTLSSGNWRRILSKQEFGVFLILLLLVGSLSLYTDTFLTPTNIFNVLRAFSWIAISAFGQCMVIITGGIDLSVGSVMGLSGLVTAMLLVQGVHIPVAVLAGLLVGLIIGFLNGLMITAGKLPPFIATLGSLLMARGLCYGLSGGWPVRDLPLAFRNLGQYDLPIGNVGVPLPLIFMIILALVTSAFLSRTVWGYRIYALGGNETATALSGINTNRVKRMVYSLCGLLAAVGGILMTARLGVAAPTAAQGYELDVIAAAVVGGTSLKGGEGTILGVLIGAAIMQVLRNGLVLIGVSAYWLQAVQGLVIVVAIMLDQVRKRRR